METAFFHLETNLSVYFCYLNEDCDTLSFSFVKWSTFLLVIFFKKKIAGMRGRQEGMCGGQSDQNILSYLVLSNSKNNQWKIKKLKIM